MLLPGGGELFEALVTDLSFVELLGVAGELMKNDVAIPLFGNALPGLFQGLWHFELRIGAKVLGRRDLEQMDRARKGVGLSKSKSKSM